MLGQLCRCGWVCPWCPRIPSKPERSRLCGQVHAQKLSKGHHGGAEQGLDPHVHLERGVGCLGKNRPLSAPAVGFGFEGTNSNLDSCGSCDTDVSQWDKKMMMHHQWGICQVFVALGFCIVFLHGHRKPSSVVRQNISAGLSPQRPSAWWLWSMAQWSLCSKVSMLLAQWLLGHPPTVGALMGMWLQLGCLPFIWSRYAFLDRGVKSGSYTTVGEPAWSFCWV